MLSWTIGAFCLSVVVGVLGYWLGQRKRIQEARRKEKARWGLEVVQARYEASIQQKKLETEARAASIAKKVAADSKSLAQQGKLFSRQENVERLVLSVQKRQLAANGRRDELRLRKRAAKERKRDAKRQSAHALSLRDKTIEALCKRTNESRSEVISRLRKQLVEGAKSDASEQVRNADKVFLENEWLAKAQRLMAISVSRYRNHFMTERMISKVTLPDRVADVLFANENRCLQELSSVSNISFAVQEDGSSLRLEGQDGVGREVARRAFSRLAKKSDARRKAKADPGKWAQDIRAQLDREILGLGKKAFSVLEIPRPHLDIVKLVGCLNFRTSFTQNQWLHAVEASFLAGMMAQELDLDVAVARRATLMHDIGKALTHKIEGSHAVIGADIARRLGEDEVVANAIGAHHAEEPANSVYAYLVAGADAMSGARPGARREYADGHSTRLKDLEDIGKSYPGVENCYAVHGGRELRVYVNEERMDDLAAIDLSRSIARRVSNDLAFPGQIKVTIIRSTEAVAIAG